MEIQDLKQHIGKRIKALREEKGLTQKSLELLAFSKTGVNASRIASYEAGRALPEWEALISLAGVFRLSLSDFLALDKLKAPARAIEEPENRKYLNQIIDDWEAVPAEFQKTIAELIALFRWI